MDSAVYTAENFPNNGAQFWNGTDSQSPWEAVGRLWPGDERAYRDTAYWAFYNAQLDASATVPQIDMVVEGILSRTSPLNDSIITITSGQYDSSGNAQSFIGPLELGALDADPAAVIFDFLTNSRYGATFPQEWIDQDTLFTSTNGVLSGVGDQALSTYCQAIGLAWSVVINNVETASSIIERWCKNLNVAVVWNGEALKFIPYYDSYSGANPGFSGGGGHSLKYYRPFIDSVATIMMDDVIQSSDQGDDPISFARKDPVEVYNTVRVDFKDRYNFYNDVPSEAKDEAHIELYGPRIDNIGLANEFSLGDYANTSATLQLRRNVGIMRTFTWKMGPLWGWLEPMLVITIPDPSDYTQAITVRITEIEDDEDENVTITAEEFFAGTQSPTILPVGATTPPNQGATNSPPSAAYPPVIFEPTNAMMTAMGYATPIFAFGDSGGTSGTLDENWGGVNVWISLDNISYEFMGTLTGPSVTGHLTATLPAFSGTNPDTVDSIVVYLGESNGSLDNSSDVAASSGHSIVVIEDDNGFEVIGYTTATLTTPYTYTLTGLYRGFYGTPARSFASGSKFLYAGTNANMLIGNLPAAYVGLNFWVKPQSFNVFNLAEQDLSDVIAYEYVVVGPSAQLALSDVVVSNDVFSSTEQTAGHLADHITTGDSFTASRSLINPFQDSAITSDLFVVIDSIVLEDSSGDWILEDGSGKWLWT
jgi:hypothetical protein